MSLDAHFKDLGIEMTGVHDVTVNGFDLTDLDTSFGVLVTESSDITLSRLHILTQSNGLTAGLPAISVVTDSHDVTIIKNTLDSDDSATIDIGTGVTGTVITDNVVKATRIGSTTTPSGISLTGTVETTVTNNTVATQHACANGIVVDSDATGTTVENNIFVAGCTNTPAVDVASDSTAGTTWDYNIVHPLASGGDLYAWGGTLDSTSASFAEDTGQGTHDSNADPQLADTDEHATAAVAVDSANPAAPGLPETDRADHAHVDDPLVPNTNDSTVDRGAPEVTDPIFVSLSVSPRLAPTGGVVTATLQPLSSWAPVTGFTVDFGDGTPPVQATSTTVQHTYAVTGNFQVTATATDALGNTSAPTGPRLNEVTIDAPAPAVVRAVAFPVAGQGVSVDTFTSTDSWTITGFSAGWGDGTTTGPDGILQHTYQKVGTYPITVTMTDAGGNTTVGTTTFTTAGGRYVPFRPTRLLDTRTGLGAGGTLGKVRANGTLKLKVAGVAGIPADVQSVALNVTVTNPATSGNVTAFPDGVTKPAVSTVNFVPGQTVPNMTIVPVGADGAVDLSVVGGPVDLIADVSGYFIAQSAANGYTTMTSSRLLDTRDGTGTGGRVAPVAAHAILPLTVAGAGGVPATGVTAVAMNVTVTGPTQAGFVTAFPDGTPQPGTSSVNFVRGQTVANLEIVPVGADGKIDFANGSTGTTHLVADVVGYFRTTGGNTYVPITPIRQLDTRSSAPIPPRRSVIASVAALPSAQAGVVLNVTVTQPTQPGFVLVGPDPLPAGLTLRASTENWTHAGETRANLAIPSAVSFNPTEISVFNGSNGTIDAIIDLSGYFQPNTPQT